MPLAELGGPCLAYYRMWVAGETYGAQNLTLGGAGATLNIAGNLDLAGGLVATAGKLSLSGTIAGSVLLHPGASLTGFGQLGGDLSNFGAVTALGGRLFLAGAVNGAGGGADGRHRRDSGAGRREQRADDHVQARFGRTPDR